MAATTLASTAFAQWLDRELSLRGSSKTKLAAAIDVKPQTIYAWFNEDRIPSPEMCRRVAGYLGLSETEVLRIAGHLAASAAPADPPTSSLPAWLTSLLDELDGYELQVVAETARGLLRLRAERERGELPPREQ